MTHTRVALVVAAWEFRRYFKWRDQVMGLLVFLLIGAISYGVGRIAASSGRTFTIGLSGIDASALPETAGDESRLRFVPLTQGTSQAAALAEGAVQGVLTRNAGAGFELLVEQDPRYGDELRTRLDALVWRERLEARGLTAAEFQQILSPATLVVDGPKGCLVPGDRPAVLPPRPRARPVR